MNLYEFKNIWQTYAKNWGILLDENSLGAIWDFSKKYNIPLFDNITGCFIENIQNTTNMMKEFWNDPNTQRGHTYMESKFITFLQNSLPKIMQCFNKMINQLAIILTAIEMRSYAQGKKDCPKAVTNTYYKSLPAGITLNDDYSYLLDLVPENLHSVVFGLSDDACSKINL